MLKLTGNEERMVRLAWTFAVAIVGLVIGLLVNSAVGEASAQNAGVCDRTEQVRDAIVAASGTASCSDVTELHHLREITSLDLSNQGITSLDAEDFDGLVRVKTLDLSGNSLTELPAGVFDPLYLLHTLRLDDNWLTTVPEDIFDEVLLLEELDLGGNPSLTLPEGMFDDFDRFSGIGANGEPVAAGGSHPVMERFLQRHGITSPEEFIEALPDPYKERFVMVYQSEAAAKDHVSATQPRVVSFGGDGRFTFAWNTDPDAPSKFRDVVEFLRQNDTDWSAGIIDFSGESPRFVEPAVCQSCHGSVNKPLWGGYGGFGATGWVGTEFAQPHGDFTQEEYDEVVAANRAAVQSTDPRIEPLDFSSSSYQDDAFGGADYGIRFLAGHDGAHGVMAVEAAGATWAWRHAEVLHRRLKSSENDYRRYALDVMCAGRSDEQFTNPATLNRAAVYSKFPTTVHKLDTPDGEGVDGLNPLSNPDAWSIQSGGTLNDPYNEYVYGIYGRGGGPVVFLAAVDLWQTEPVVRKLFRDTSNEVGASRPGSSFRSFSYYPWGSATVEDELIQKLRLHFGRGTRVALEERARQNAKDGMSGSWSSAFVDGLMGAMAPRVCSALRDSNPENLVAETSGGHVILDWDAPGWETGSVTGYRILRGVGGGPLAPYVSDTGTTSTTWVDNSPGSGQFVYAVEAIYGDHYASRASNEADLDISLDVTLSATTTDQSATISWDLPVTGYINDMYLERLDDESQVEWSTIVATDQHGDEPSSWQESDYHFLVAGTTYRYRVKLDTDDHGVLYSDVLEVTTQSDPPLAPTGLSATATHDAVSLSWTMPEQPAWVTGPVSLDVMRTRSVGKTLEVGSVPWPQGVTAYSFTDAGLWAGQTYRYFIRARMGARYHYSTEVSITTAVQPEDPDGTREGAIVLDAVAAAGRLQDLYGYSVNRNGGDVVDYYTFTTTARHQLNFGVWRIRGEGNDSVHRGVTLEDAQGNTVLASSPPPDGARRESLETAIAPGTYYVRVEAMDDAPFSYLILFGLEPPPLTGFTLLDASDQSVLATLTDGAVVELADPDGGSYAIRALAHADASIGSVRLDLSGAKAVSQTENLVPYSLYGDNGENALHGEALPVGGYVLRATAYLEKRLGGRQLAEPIQVSFTVRGPNSPPQLGSATYSFSVAEDATTGTAVGSVSATDADNDTLTYTIEAGNEDGKFAIDGATGAITTAGALDYETDASYTLTVQADDGNGGTDTATVNATVTDVEEDPDATRAGAVSLGNQSRDRGRQYFYDKSLDAAGGDRVDYYTFTTDGRYSLGLGVREQSIELKVTLEDADGNKVGTAGPPADPNLDQVYIEWLKTPIDAGTYYIRVEALEDGQTDYYIRFSLESPPPKAPTGVAVYDFTSGHLDVRWSFSDFDATDEFKLQWKSGDQEYDASRQVLVNPAIALVPESSTETKRRYMHGISGLVDGTGYTVRVIAVNEHGDSVPSSEATGTPNSSPGQARSFFENELINIHGDAHPWLRQVWSYLTENNADVAFARNRNQVVPSCGSTGNGGHECSIGEVVVDRMFVSGSIGVLTHELAHAFTIGTGAPAEPAPVAIGFIYFKKFRGKLEIPQRFDSRCNEAELYADAMTMVVHPELPLRSLSYWSECVGDDADRTEEALTVARSVLAGEMPSWFEDTYHDETGEPDLDALWSDVGTVRYRIGAVANLRDAFGGYCNGETDWPGNPWVGNDGCPPKFERNYRFIVVDDAAVGASVGSVSATDLDGDTLTYSFSKGNDDGKFAIDGSTGAITLAGALDYDTDSYYRLTVQADDGNADPNTALASILVRDADERAPVFGTSTTTTVAPESQSTNVDFLWLAATDPNGDSLTYSIEAGNGDGKFTIRTETDSTNGDYGVISTVGALDYETTSFYSLTVQADDGNGGIATATFNILVLDVSEDGAPVFDYATQVRRNFSVPEDSAVGHLVATVQASDPNGDTLTYSTEAGNGDGKFAIDGSTGAITVAGALDYETTPSYTLTVQADDGNGGTATVTLNITVTDVEENNVPEFGSATYSFSIAEDADTGAAVGSVSATDADNDTLTYTIESGNGDAKFAIDGGTGAITTAGALDYETDASYTLTVQADDGNGGTATATVNATVTDVEENSAPAFEGSTYAFSVAEDAATGAAVGSVSATDADDDTLTYTIEAGNEDGKFAINDATGAMTTAGALDYETGASYTLTVQADDDNDGTDTATVNIIVTNVVEPSEGPLTGFTLVDASNQAALASLGGGARVGLADPDNGSYGIRADVDSEATVGSVRLELRGAKSISRTENIAPYSLYGDGGENDLHGEALPAGSYTVTATAYEQRDLGGDTLGTLQMSFAVAAVESGTYRGQLAEAFLELTRSTFDSGGAQTVGKVSGGLVRGAQATTGDTSTTSIVYVIDDSASMDGDFPEVRTALEAVSGEDMDNTKVALIAFGTSPKTLFGLTAHSSAPWDDHIDSFGAKLHLTDYTKPLQQATALLAADDADTKKVIFFTDGQKPFPTDEVLALRAAGIVVDTIAFGDHYSDRFDAVERIATATRGTHKKVTPPSQGTTNTPAVTATSMTSILNGTVAENTATLFLVDGSYSLRGENYSLWTPLEAAWTTADSTTGAQLGLAVFGGKAEGRSYKKYRVVRDIGSASLGNASFAVTESTDIDNALLKAFATVSAASPTAKRVVLITDGISGVDVANTTLNKYKNDSNVTLYVVASGGHADRVQLKTWADAASGSFFVAS